MHLCTVRHLKQLKGDCLRYLDNPAYTFGLLCKSYVISRFVIEKFYRKVWHALKQANNLSKGFFVVFQVSWHFLLLNSVWSLKHCKQTRVLAPRLYCASEIRLISGYLKKKKKNMSKMVFKSQWLSLHMDRGSSHTSHRVIQKLITVSQTLKRHDLLCLMTEDTELKAS